MRKIYIKPFIFIEIIDEEEPLTLSKDGNTSLDGNENEENPDTKIEGDGGNTGDGGFVGGSKGAFEDFEFNLEP